MKQNKYDKSHVVLRSTISKRNLDSFVPRVSTQRIKNIHHTKYKDAARL